MNNALAAMEQSGEMSTIFNKWLGPKTPYGLTRTDKVTPIGQLKFTPMSWREKGGGAAVRRDRLAAAC